MSRKEGGAPPEPEEPDGLILSQRSCLERPRWA
uniref:Uncharacterized protein n=1 Tax=Arundo donax TaxID=35708 RepID=A0A0A9AUV2_ARUDO